jgi:hypothetical protein
VARQIRKVTSNSGADVCIEFSGSRQALQAALRSAAFGGTVVCGAYPAPYEAGLDFGGEAHLNIPNLVFSPACSEPNRDHPRWSFTRIDSIAGAGSLRASSTGRRSSSPSCTSTTCSSSTRG